ncbi:unnamed protein product [Rotaria sp. Silwood2]|nr:unnamed protein product [Rotaria sp. Silwood2]
MSVDINNFDPTRVLVGVPYLNTVFHFTVSGGGRILTLSDQKDNGNSVGFGKGVAWLASDQAAGSTKIGRTKNGRTKIGRG